MSLPRTKEREKEFKLFLKNVWGLSYSKKALKWFQKNLNQIVTSKELARIPGKDGDPISHNLRRIFELRDEQGYEIINWKDNQKNKLNLKVDEWVLLKPNANPVKIRPRGVNKRIMFEVFERDQYTCQICGRTPKDDDPFAQGRKIRLHVGHIIAHKRKDGEDVYKFEKIEDMKEKHNLTKSDFITLCNVCNEGAKNRDIKVFTLLDRIKKVNLKEKKKIFIQLKKEFEKYI